MGTSLFSRGSRLRLVGAVYGLAIAGMVLGFILLFGVSLAILAPLGVGLTGVNVIVLSLVTLQGIAFPTVAVLYFRYKGRSLREFIPISVPTLKQAGLIIVTWIATVIGVQLVAAAVIRLTGTQPAENGAAQTAAQNPEFIPFLILLVFLFNAPGEELLFRGVIQGLLRERFGPVGAILLATGAFAPIHITALAGSPQAALLTISILSVPSIVFGTVYEITDNLVVPTLVHGLYNATLFVGLFLTVTG